MAKGSARSIAGFDLFKNLSECREILPHFGGHPMAAGMTLKLEDVSDLRQRLNNLANEQLTKDDFVPITLLDHQINVDEINLSSLDELNLLAPFGMDNPKPKVLIRDVQISTMRKIGSEQNHLKVMVNDNGTNLDGIGFGLGQLVDHISPASKISIIGELAINEWNNIRKPQIFIQDVSVESWQLFDHRGVKRIHSLVNTIPNENRNYIIFNKEQLDKIDPALKSEVILIQDGASSKGIQFSSSQCSSR